MTLTKYCAPIRHTPLDEIDTQAVLKVLKPLWTRAPETASRLRGRIEALLNVARALGHIDDDKANPARLARELLSAAPSLRDRRLSLVPFFSEACDGAFG
jgi:hypothetical protein